MARFVAIVSIKIKSSTQIREWLCFSRVIRVSCYCEIRFFPIASSFQSSFRAYTGTNCILLCLPVYEKIINHFLCKNDESHSPEDEKARRDSSDVTIKSNPRCSSPSHGESSCRNERVARAFPQTNSSLRDNGESFKQHQNSRRDSQIEVQEIVEILLGLTREGARRGKGGDPRLHRVWSTP